MTHYTHAEVIIAEAIADSATNGDIYDRARFVVGRLEAAGVNVVYRTARAGAEPHRVTTQQQQQAGRLYAAIRTARENLSKLKRMQPSSIGVTIIGAVHSDQMDMTLRTDNEIHDTAGILIGMVEDALKERIERCEAQLVELGFPLLSDGE